MTPKQDRWRPKIGWPLFILIVWVLWMIYYIGKDIILNR
jgi:hypothetical protein